MNRRDANLLIPDVQSSPDTRELAIDRVGIRGLRYPVVVRDAHGADCHTVATFEMGVRLAHSVKGTHMSRFIELLESHSGTVWSLDTLGVVLGEMLNKLEVTEGGIRMSFAWFVHKTAPVSGVKSLMDYAVTLRADRSATGDEFSCEVVVPVTSLCPCSKEIAVYGAHNQRSHITLQATGTNLTPETLIRIAEQQASSELYGILKRPDEKYVTERAYDNPKFVEDLVRDIAAVLNADPAVLAYRVETENFESIHNHSAWAVIARDKRV